MSAEQSASPAASGRSPLDSVRALQHTLYRAAKADPGRRFHALWDKVLRRDVLWRAWVAVRANNGAPGVDRTTVGQVEEYGVSRLLDELADELRQGRYRPVPARRVFIPKPGSNEQRPLSIPAVRDRIVQAAVKIVVEPIFEADFAACSFGFRPKRGAHDALQVVIDEAGRGRRWVVETDIASCFEAIPHDRLMQAVQERVVDQPVLKLLRIIQRCSLGGVISPMLCNVYLHRLDRQWDTRAHGVLVRYADDLLAMCATRQQAEAALARLRELLAELGLAPKEAKTRIVQLAEGAEGFDFLGFHHRQVRSKRVGGTRGFAYLARWPADKAMGRARDKLRGFTQRSRLALNVETVVQDMNLFLRGWAGYFRFGHSTIRLCKIRQYALERLAIFIGKRHKSRRPRAYGMSALLRTTDQYGLIQLVGIAVPPRAGKPWRAKPNTGGERRR